MRDERDKEAVQIVEIEAGKEPPGFTVHFAEWRLEKAQKWLDADPAKQPVPTHDASGVPIQKSATKKELTPEEEK